MAVYSPLLAISASSAAATGSPKLSKAIASLLIFATNSSAVSKAGSMLVCSRCRKPRALGPTPSEALDLLAPAADCRSGTVSNAGAPSAPTSSNCSAPNWPPSGAAKPGSLPSSGRNPLREGHCHRPVQHRDSGHEVRFPSLVQHKPP